MGRDRKVARDGLCLGGMRYAMCLYERSSSRVRAAGLVVGAPIIGSKRFIREKASLLAKEGRVNLSSRSVASAL